MPSGVKTKVQSIVAFEDEPESAGAGRLGYVTLEDEIDLSRGDMLVGEANPPSSGTEFQAIARVDALRAARSAQDLRC